MGCTFCIPRALGTDPRVYFPDGMPDRVVHITPDSLPELIEEFVEGLSSSFCGSSNAPGEASLSWGLGTQGVTEITKPLPLEVVENKENFEKRKEFFRYCVKLSFTGTGRHGGCFALIDDDGKMCSYTITLPPNNKALHSPGMCEYTWMVNQLGGWSNMNPAFLEGEEAVRLDLVERTMQANHKKHAHDPHLFIYYFGTSPDKQGKGHGHTLLQHILAAADRMKVPTYLDCGGESNENFWTKHGFQVVERVPMSYVSQEKTKEYGEKTEIAFKPDGLEGLSACVRQYNP